VESSRDAPVSEMMDSGTIAGRYRASIYRYILRLVGDPARADDLTQETFLRVHRRIGGLRDPAAVEAWLYRIATNLCYDTFRQREHRSPPTPLVALGEGSAALSDEAALHPDQLLDQNEMSDCVLRFLSDLPDSQREVLLQHDLQGFTGPEIADRLGLTIHNVKIRLHRARVALRAALSEGCDFSRDDRGVFVCQPKRSPDV
jgi:RNA polymerase sigma-70 factor (ECF subfamily)